MPNNPNAISPRPTKATLVASTAIAPDTDGILSDYMSEAACAAELGIAPITLAIWRMQKKGPPVTRLSRRVLYKKSSVRDWLAAQEGPP